MPRSIVQRRGFRIAARRADRLRLRERRSEGTEHRLSGTNLTDEPFLLSNVEVDPYHLIKYEKYGAVYALAVSYSF